MRMKIDRDTQGIDVFKVLKKCRWTKDDKECWWIAGQMIGARNHITYSLKNGIEIDGPLNKRKQIYAKPGDVFSHKFKHLYFHNGEGFVDIFQIEVTAKERK